MQVSINGTSKEVIQFLLGLSGQIAGALSKPAPVVTEVRDPVPVRTVEASAEQNAQIAGAARTAPADNPEGAKAEAAPAANAKLEPVADAAKPEPTPEPTAKPKARKSRLTPIVPAAGEVKPEPVAGAAKPEPKPEPTPETVSKSGVIPENLLPLGWATWSVAKRRLWAQTQPGLSANERFVLLQANPLTGTEKPEPVAAAKPEPVAETKPEPATEPATTGAAPAEGDGVDCPLPPTWEAWSLPKKIMWATMRSAGETATLLKQFGFADKIGPVDAENLFQVRRKLEIAMRMEAQA